MKTYRLGSSELVGAPGIIAWAISGFWNEPDQDYLLGVVTATWKVPTDAAKALLSKQVPYTVEDGAVVFTHGS